MIGKIKININLKNLFSHFAARDLLENVKMVNKSNYNNWRLTIISCSDLFIQPKYTMSKK